MSVANAIGVKKKGNTERAGYDARMEINQSQLDFYALYSAMHFTATNRFTVYRKRGEETSKSEWSELVS